MMASLFILAALNKLISYDSTLLKMSEAGLIFEQLLLPLIILLEGLGGLVIAIGIRYAWIAALTLAVYTLLTNMFFHRFWELSGELRTIELSLFFKNISICGGMVMLAANEKLESVKSA